MGKMFLQVTDATVVVHDLRGFSGLAARLGPLELGAALERFYEHVEAVTVAAGGRVIKFVGDLVFSAWLASEVDDHRRQAVAAVAASHARRKAWVQEGIDAGMPILDYAVAAASGQVLVGHIGTERMRSFDVLGEPTSLARKLAVVATGRALDHLIAAEALEGAGRPVVVEVEGVELGGRHVRLYRLG